MRHIVPLLVLLTLAAPAALSAQSDAPLGPGTRVRVTAPTVLKRRVAARVVRMTPDTLVVWRRDDEFVIPLDAVERIELSGGKDRVLGALWGTGIGAAGGAALGGLACVAADDGCSDSVLMIIAVYGGGLVGGGVGLIAGAVIGDERWRTTRVSTGSPFTLAPAPGGGVAAGVSVRF